MCTGKFVRFFCPEAIAQNPLCPRFDHVGKRVRAYAQLWVQTKFVCCGNHRGDCLECPALHHPGNVEYQNANALECDDCGARLREERAAEMEEMGGLDEGEDTDEMVSTESEAVQMEDSGSSGASHVSDSENAEMTDADVEIDIEVDGDMDVEIEIVSNCKDCVNER